MRVGKEEESVYALGSSAPSAPKQGGPRVAKYMVQAPGQKVKMHVDSSQVASCLNPVRGVRDAQRRAGIKPTDHAKQNLMAVKERSRLNALRRMSQEEDEETDVNQARRTAAPSQNISSSVYSPGGPAFGRSNSSSGAGRAPAGSGIQRQHSSSSGGSGGASGRNFIEENKAVAAAARHAAKAEAKKDDGLVYMSKREYGRVPSYLVERKLQMAEEQRALEAAREAAKVPPGMRLMPESERLETLALLERNRAEVEVALSAMPIIIETHTLRRRKDDLERRLAEIEEARRVFSRKQVLVRQ